MIELEHEEENKENEMMIQMIHEQYAVNCLFYEVPREKLSSELHDKMISLLTRENKKNFPYNQDNNTLVIKWFR